jgi:hypothetical protein
MFEWPIAIVCTVSKLDLEEKFLWWREIFGWPIVISYTQSKLGGCECCWKFRSSENVICHV